MHRFHTIVRFGIGLGVVGSVAACFSSDNNDVLGPRLRGANAIFQNYAAIG